MDKVTEKGILLAAFRLLGGDYPLTLDYRRKLSRVLF